MANQNQKLIVTYKKAFQNKPELDAFLTHLANQSGARPISNLKNPKTALEKVKTKQQEDPDRNYTLDTVNDIARARLVYGGLHQLRNGVKDIRKDIKQTNMKIAKVDDFFDHPEDGYEGYHIDVVFPNGQHSEIQLHTINSYAATLVTHPLHEEADHEEMTDEDKQKNKDLNDQVKKLKPNEAVAVAQMLEAKNAPLQRQSQIAAIQTAQGNPPPMQPVPLQQGGQQNAV